MIERAGRETVFSIRPSFATFGFDVSIGIKDFGDNKISVFGLSSVAEHEYGTVPHPTLQLSSDEAVKLMDELWRNGIRPSNGEGSVGQIGAVTAHLDDMRRLVFKGNFTPINRGK